MAPNPSTSSCYDKMFKKLRYVYLDIYNDASDHQLVAVIMQGKKSIAFYSRKINEAQRRYISIERKFLSTIESYIEC
jgi:hypothetical protein